MATAVSSDETVLLSVLNAVLMLSISALLLVVAVVLALIPASIASKLAFISAALMVVPDVKVFGAWVSATAVAARKMLLASMVFFNMVIPLV